MKKSLFNLLLIIGILMQACGGGGESESTDTSSDSTKDALPEESIKVGQEFLPQDVTFGGTYICENRDGSIERLFIEEEGKKIYYNSSDSTAKVSLGIVKSERQDFSGRDIIEVAFPGTPQPYVLTVKFSGTAILSASPEGIYQMFYKEIEDPKDIENVWQFLEKGREMESIAPYLSDSVVDLEASTEDLLLYLKPELDSYPELQNYLGKTYTKDAVGKVMDKLGLNAKNGRLVSYTFMGGSLGKYPESKLIATDIQADTLRFEYILPWATREQDEIKIEIVKGEDKVWRLNEPTGLGLR